VDLSEPKILKQPENGGTAAVGSILKGLGVKSEMKFPTPEEFVRSSHGLGGEESGKSVPGFVSASALGLGGGFPSPQGLDTATVNTSLMSMLGSSSSSQTSKSSDEVDGMSVSNWGRCLDIILQAEMGPSVPLENDAMGVYKIEITDTPSGTETYFFELTPDVRRIRSEADPPKKKPDVSLVVSSTDLAGVLEGSLSPLQVLTLLANPVFVSVYCRQNEFKNTFIFRHI